MLLVDDWLHRPRQVNRVALRKLNHRLDDGCLTQLRVLPANAVNAEQVGMFTTFRINVSLILLFSAA